VAQERKGNWVHVIGHFIFQDRRYSYAVERKTDAETLYDTLSINTRVSSLKIHGLYLDYGFSINTDGAKFGTLISKNEMFGSFSRIVLWTQNIKSLKF
jgi:hypothetical protein